jgi:phosphoribosyl 1,2-cyclic phosphodiesterase
MGYQVTVWGARGSIPTPGPQTARYGGNTPCVAVTEHDAKGERLVVLDAGTGIRLLGRHLVEAANGPLTVDLLMTHTHWDHIQGLPFFAPVFGKGNAVRIWGAQQGDVPLEGILRDQMKPVVFPVPLDQVAAELRVEHVTPGAFEIDGFAVRATRLRHPGTTLGYRLTPIRGGASMAYITDNELGPGGDYDVGPTWRRDLVEFLAGVDVMIHDATYNGAEIEHHRGWGHSSHTESVELAVEAGVARLVLFHHRPEHDDAGMDTMVAEARALARDMGSGIEVLAATEGLELTL